MEIYRALGAALEPPSPQLQRLAELLDLGPMPEPAAHTDLLQFQLYPYASVYLGNEGQLGGEARDRIAGFLRALGSKPPDEPDHLTYLLACLADLDDQAVAHPADPRPQQARDALLSEHLLPWLPFYLDRMLELAPPFYRRWAEVLLRALRQTALQSGGSISLPLHLRQAEALPAVDQDLAKEPFLGLLISPVRCGLILTRDDLVRAAADLQLGARIGERRFVLEALLGQDPAATCTWLMGEAERQAQRHLRHLDWLGPIAEYWHSRALACRHLLEHMKPEHMKPEPEHAD